MSPIAAFVLGLLVGWIIEWIIDWWYWRRRVSVLERSLSQAKNRLGTAEESSKSQPALSAEVLVLRDKAARFEADKLALDRQISALTAEKAALSEQLAACQGRMAAREPAAFAEKSAAPIDVEPGVMPAAALQPDDLEVIKGIGPVIKRKLNEGGIYTFEQLAALNTTQLEQIVGEVIQRLADEDAILREAKELADKKAGRG